MTANLSNSIKDFNDFKSACNYFDIEMNNNQSELFKTYYEILIEWNKKINLISRRGVLQYAPTILEKHFLDSILFLPEITHIARRRGPETSPSVFDIGSGGGFPAIPLAIMKPNWHFTLCESIKKKANFLNCLIKELGFKNVIVINARVETLHATSLRYDFVTARAVAKLDELIKYALPLLKKDGYLIAYKSKNIDDEIKNINLPSQIFSKEVNGVERKLVVICAGGVN